MPITQPMTRDPWNADAERVIALPATPWVDPALDSMVKRIASQIASAGEDQDTALTTVRRKLGDDAIVEQIETALLRLNHQHERPTVAHSIATERPIDHGQHQPAQTAPAPGLDAPSAPAEKTGSAGTTSDTLAEFYASLARSFSAPAPQAPKPAAAAAQGLTRTKLERRSVPLTVVQAAPHPKQISPAAPISAALQHQDNEPQSIAEAERAFVATKQPQGLTITRPPGLAEHPMPTTEHLADMEARLTAAVAAIANRPPVIDPAVSESVLQTAIAALKDEIGTLRTDVAQFNPIHDVLGRLAGRIDSVDRQLTDAAKDATHTARLTSIDERLALLEQHLAATRPAVETTHGMTSAIEQAIAALADRIDSWHQQEPSPALGQWVAPPAPTAPSQTYTAPAAHAIQEERNAPHFVTTNQTQPELAPPADAPAPSPTDARAGVSGEDLVASARRAARATANRSATFGTAPVAVPVPETAQPSPASVTATALQSAIAPAPTPGPEVMNRHVRRPAAPAQRPAPPTGSFLTNPKVLLVGCAIVLACLCAGLLFGKMSGRRTASLTMERINGAAKAVAAAPTTADQLTSAIAEAKRKTTVAQPEAQTVQPNEPAQTASTNVSPGIEPVDPAAGEPPLTPVDAALKPQFDGITPAETTAPSLVLPPTDIGSLSLRMAAAKGDAQAQYSIGLRYADPKFKQKSPKAASVWFERAAKQGFALAQYRLGALYERGQGVPRSFAKARDWYGQAAELGNVKAMHNLAVVMTNAEAGAPDYPTAALWFGKAATFGLADSQFNLAVLHENGLGVDQSHSEAYRWYSLAALQGDAEAAKRRDSSRLLLAPATIVDIDGKVANWRAEPREPGANEGVRPQASLQSTTQAAQLTGSMLPSAPATPAALASESENSTIADIQAAYDAPKAAPATKIRNGPSVDQIALVQQLLAKLGFDPGLQRGSLDQKTREAIRAFEDQAGMAQTGQLSADLLRKLRAQAG
jgi:TPR repeat protein